LGKFDRFGAVMTTVIAAAIALLVILSREAEPPVTFPVSICRVGGTVTSVVFPGRLVAMRRLAALLRRTIGDRDARFPWGRKASDAPQALSRL